MEHSALLGDIDLLPLEHGIDALTQARRRCQFQEQTDGFVSHAVLRVVQVDANSFECETLTSLRILGEERSQMKILNLLVMFLKCPPGRTLCQRRRIY